MKSFDFDEALGLFDEERLPPGLVYSALTPLRGLSEDHVNRADRVSSTSDTPNHHVATPQRRATATDSTEPERSR